VYAKNTLNTNKLKQRFFVSQPIQKRKKTSPLQRLYTNFAGNNVLIITSQTSLLKIYSTLAQYVTNLFSYYITKIKWTVTGSQVQQLGAETVGKRLLSRKHRNLAAVVYLLPTQTRTQKASLIVNGKLLQDTNDSRCTKNHDNQRH